MPTEINRMNESCINNFIDQVRFETRQHKQGGGPQPGTSRAVQIEEADRSAEELVLQAERFRAATELPQGRGDSIDNLVSGVGMSNLLGHQPDILGKNVSDTAPSGVLPIINANQMQQVVDPWAVNNMQTAMLNKPVGITDDEFFHLTCHVDPNLKQKIERGEFVDLEKLLVRNQFKNGNAQGQRMELVSRGGETFIMPVDRDNKITNVRRWQQAFCIYAAIYSQANPQ